MGKKSKRRVNNGSGGIAKSNQPPASKPKEKEALENLMFEDPFEDVFEEEEIVQSSDNELVDEDRKPEESTNTQREVTTKAWTPSQGLEPGQALEMDERAYTMHHALTPEWPALSFDFVRDSYGEGRVRFPHTVLAVIGTQASKREWNKVQLLKMTDLGRTSKEPRDLKKRKSDEEKQNDDSDESSDEDMDDEDEAEDSDEEEEIDHDPILEHITLNHNGGVNRIRVMPHHGNASIADTLAEFLISKRIVSTWSDEGHVSLYDIAPCLDYLDRSAGKFTDAATSQDVSTSSRKPFFTYRGHKSEGYAMDWSRVRIGNLATGDCNGQIHIWDPTDSAYQITCAYDNSKFKARNNLPRSIEDIQWSPTEATVFAAAECQGAIQIYDTRRTGKPMITHLAHVNTDVNVLSWNAQVNNLLASGADDGAFCVWDLRTFGAPGGKPPAPLARFSYSQKPITSVEWHPTDESMILVTDEDATYVYDLSIEADAESEQRMSLGSEEVEVPPQLLFLHCGSQNTKEAHWHPQIPSLVMTTALSGFNLFIPSNL